MKICKDCGYEDRNGHSPKCPNYIKQEPPFMTNIDKILEEIKSNRTEGINCQNLNGEDVILLTEEKFKQSLLQIQKEEREKAIRECIDALPEKIFPDEDDGNLIKRNITGYNVCINQAKLKLTNLIKD